jgi:uncharacterized protein
MVNMRKYFVMLALCASTLGAQERTHILDPKLDALFPARPTNYLTDVAGIIKNPAAINSSLQQIRTQDSLSLVVVTLPTLKGYDVADVAREIGRKWMVATANDTIGAFVRNTGGVILISMDPRKCRVEVATGSEGYMTDSRAADACRAAATHFKAGDFDVGVISIANEFARRHNAARAEVAPVNPTEVTDGSSSVAVILFVTLGVVGLIIVVALVIRRRAAAEEREWERQAAWNRARTPYRTSVPMPQTAWIPSTPAAAPTTRRSSSTASSSSSRRSSSYSSPSPSYDPPSSSYSSSSSSSSYSSGGSDSFGGGGGGSDF